MQDLFFEGRTLKPYGDFVLAANLIVGHTYFRTAFLDEDMAVPELTAVVFLGRDLNPQLPGLYFQDAPSYFAGIRPPDDLWKSALHDGGDLPDGYSWVNDDIKLDWEPEDTFGSVYEFESALESLLGCSLRRRKWDGIVRPVATREEPDS